MGQKSSQFTAEELNDYQVIWKKVLIVLLLSLVILNYNFKFLYTFKLMHDIFRVVNFILI